MSDKYPRVWGVRFDSATGARRWEESAGGGCKVVPDSAIVIERDVDPTPTSARALVRSVLGVQPYVRLGTDLLNRAEAASARTLRAVAYLRAHPLVDEAEVERVRQVLKGMGNSWERGDAELAEYLWKAGLRATADSAT